MALELGELQRRALAAAVKAQKSRDEGAPDDDVVKAYSEAVIAAQDYLIQIHDNAPEEVYWTNYINLTSTWLASREKVSGGKNGSDGSNLSDDDENWKAKLFRDKKGAVLSTASNAYHYLQYHKDVRGFIRWNAFSKRVEVAGGALKKRITNGTSVPSIDMIVNAVEDWLQIEAEITVRYADLRRRVVDVAQKNAYNPLADYLDSLEWDRTPRIDNLLIEHLGAKTETVEGHDITEHVRRVTRRWFISAVARALDPGCQVDTVLILEGVSGLRKSSFFRELGREFACETELAVAGNKDAKQLAASRWIIELAELDSLRGRDTSAVNAFLTMRKDFYRPPYGAEHVESLRMCIFVGTTNLEEYIVDPIGDRRYWPIYVTRVDIRVIEDLRDQLWAEAVALYKAGGKDECDECATSYFSGGEQRCVEHRWWLDAVEQKIADGRTAERQESHAWEGKIFDWWVGLGRVAVADRIDPNNFVMGDVLKALDIPTERWGTHQKSLGMTLKKMGFERKQSGAVKWRGKWYYAPGAKILVKREAALTQRQAEAQLVN